MSEAKNLYDYLRNLSLSLRVTLKRAVERKSWKYFFVCIASARWKLALRVNFVDVLETSSPILYEIRGRRLGRRIRTYSLTTTLLLLNVMVMMELSESLKPPVNFLPPTQAT